MDGQAGTRSGLRILGLALLVTWAATAAAVSLAYHPGGPWDLVVAMAWWLPVAVAAGGVARPATATGRRFRIALAWLGIVALLLAVPLLLGVLRILLRGGPQILVPSPESAYAGLLALASLSLFSLIGLAQQRGGSILLPRTALLRALGLALLASGSIGAVLGVLMAVNDRAVHEALPAVSRFGPTDQGITLPGCDAIPALGGTAQVRVRARALVDGSNVGRAWLDGARDGLDEHWKGGWGGPDDSDGVTVAYVRRGTEALLAGAAGNAWEPVAPAAFGMSGADGLTMDGPVRALLASGLGDASHLIAEDRGLSVVEGAPARLCAVHVDGPMALSAVLPLRWLVDSDPVGVSRPLSAWRGELLWWVFGDGQLGRAEVSVSGLAAEAWPSGGARGVLEADLVAVDRGMPVEMPSPSPGTRY